MSAISNVEARILDALYRADVDLEVGEDALVKLVAVAEAAAKEAEKHGGPLRYPCPCALCVALAALREAADK